jgi:hypothetical protein
VPPAELDQESVERAELHAMSAAGVANPRRFDVVLPIRRDEGQGRETFNKLVVSLRTLEPLQQFLKDESGCEDLLGPEQSVPEGNDLRREMFNISA